jgi:hypothetical protein
MDKEGIERQINSLFENNKLDVLKDFMRKRKYLNACNIYILYLFHIIQLSGILISSIGANLNDTKFIWLGISLNMLATLIQVYEKINYFQLKKIMNDIKLIKEDNYR